MGKHRHRDEVVRFVIEGLSFFQPAQKERRAGFKKNGSRKDHKHAVEEKHHQRGKHIVGEQRDGVGSDQADQADPGFNGQETYRLIRLLFTVKQLDRINPVDLNQ